MKRAKHPHSPLVEHYLVPLALIVLNIGLVHVLYAYTSGRAGNPWQGYTLTVAVAALGIALLLKKRSYLVLAMLFYVLVAGLG